MRPGDHLKLHHVDGRDPNEEAMDGLQRFLDTNRAAYAKRLGLPAAPPVRHAPQALPRVRLDANGNIVR